MRNALTLLVAGAVVAVAWGQPGSAHLRARTPTPGELDRVNMKLEWTIGLPIEGPRDGIATVQLIPIPDPARKGAETVLLVVQTRSGTLAVYQADTGRKLWSKQPPPAYPVSIPEVSYDPRGALVVVRDLNLYRYEIYATQAAAGSTDESDNRLAVMPNMPTTSPAVVIADPSKRDEGVIVVCFNGNRLAVYGKAFEDIHVKPDTSVLNWKVRYEDDATSIFKPGNNRNPSLAVVRSVFGPDYGWKASKQTEPEPPTASLTMVRDLSRPREFSTSIASTPSLTIVDTLTRLGEYSRRDVLGPRIDATTRRGDILDFRIGQPPAIIRTQTTDLAGRGSGTITKLVLVGTEHDIQIDSITERVGLIPDRKVGHNLLRSDISAPATFLGNMMYVATADGTLYALDTEFGLVAWTASLQNAATHRPAVIGPHVFVVGRMGRMYRLNADDGGPAAEGGFQRDGSFPGLQARQFLAASEQHAYCTDRSGNLVVLDRRRGTPMGRVDVGGFTTTFLNDTTDRVILGSNDGKLICLRDASAPTQKLYRSNTLPAAGAAAPPPAAAPAPMEGAKPATNPGAKPVKPVPKDS